MKRMMVLAIGFFAILGAANEAQAQKIRTYTSNEEDSMLCVQSLSLYGEFYKQKNYADAVVGWRKAFEICPKSRESLYIYGTNIYEYLLKNSKDAALKQNYFDTIMMIYDKRIEHFGQEGYVLGRKGSDYLKLNSKDPKSAYDILLKSFEMEQSESEAGVLVYLYQAAYYSYTKDLISKADMIALYPRLMAVVNAKLSAGNTKYAVAEENINKIFAPLADCPDLEALFKPKFEADPENKELIDQIAGLLDSKNCTESEFYIAVARKKYELAPDASAAYAIGNWYLSNQNFSEAAKFYGEATNTEDLALKEKAYLKKAASQLGLKNYSSAKSDALEVLKLNANSGEAYIIIGDAYAYGGKSLSSNDCENRAGYWAAVDKYYRAKNVDNSLAEKADKKINIAVGQFPSKETCFFHGISEGSDYTVGGWIGETTKVRFN